MPYSSFPEVYRFVNDDSQLTKEDEHTLFSLTKILYVMKPKVNILVVRGELPGVNPSRLVARFAL